MKDIVDHRKDGGGGVFSLPYKVFECTVVHDETTGSVRGKATARQCYIIITRISCHVGNDGRMKVIVVVVVGGGVVVCSRGKRMSNKGMRCFFATAPAWLKDTLYVIARARLNETHRKCLESFHGIQVVALD